MIYTFYSYKGGVGRSMAMVNVAELMYRAGRKVIMVDWDLEAPGLEKFYPDLAESTLDSPGIIDLLVGYKERAERYRPDSSTPLFDPEEILSHLIDLRPNESSAGKLWLMPAGRRAGDQFVEYANRVKTFDWQDFYQNWEGEVYFEWLRRRLNDLADTVLIDSRTGVTEMGGVCAYQLADTVVMFCSANEQNMDGTLRMVKSFSDPRLPELRPGRELQIIVVPSRIERLSETVTLNRFRQAFSDRFRKYMPDYFRSDPSALINLEIPYVPFYAFEETIAVSQQRKDERSVELENAYNRLFRALDPSKISYDDARSFSLTYLDFELKISLGQDGIHQVAVLQSPAGEARGSFTFPFDYRPWENLWNDLRIASSMQRLSDSTRHNRVHEAGNILFNALFSDNVRSLYYASSKMSESQAMGLRISLRVEDPALAALPWELMYDPQRGEFVALSNRTPIIRLLSLPQPTRSGRPFSPPLRILGLISSPINMPQLDVERERQQIEIALSGMPQRELVEVSWLANPTVRDLQSVLRRGPWHVFHFVGHGYLSGNSGEAGILLADTDGRTVPLSGSKLGSLFGDQTSLRLAVLNSGEVAREHRQGPLSSVAETLVRHGLPAVIAMQQEISERAAVEIFRAFYEALIEGYPVDAAVAEARKAVAIAIDGSPEWSAPVLYMGTRNELLFDIVRQKPSTHSQQLKSQLNELQWRYDTLNKRIAALDKDIARTVGATDRLVLEERRNEIVADRQMVMSQIKEFEQQLHPSRSYTRKDL